jgi:hypothetical protein
MAADKFGDSTSSVSPAKVAQGLFSPSFGKWQFKYARTPIRLVGFVMEARNRHCQKYCPP